MNELRILVISPAALLPSDEELGRAQWFQSFFETLENATCDFAIAGATDLGSRVLQYDGVVLWDEQESAWSDNSRNDNLLDVIAICQYKKISFLGVGFGAELLSRALDGTESANGEVSHFAHNELLYGVPYDFAESGKALADFVLRLNRARSSETFKV